MPVGVGEKAHPVADALDAGQYSPTDEYQGRDADCEGGEGREQEEQQEGE